MTGHRSITSTYRKLYAGVRDGAEDLMPLTGAQRRFHHTRSADPLGRVRVLPVFVEFPPGVVSTARLERAARSVLRRHPALRGTAGTPGGVPVLRIGPVPADPVVREVPAGGVWTALADWPAGAGPFRVLLARDDRRDLLAVGFDHLVCDGEATGLVLDDLMTAYEGELPDGDPDRYRAVVEAQLDREHAASDPEALAHWTARVRDAGPGAWGRDRDPGAEGGCASTWHRGPRPADRPFPVLLEACHRALRRTPGTAPVAYTWGGPDKEGVVGCFVNTVLANPQDDGVQESWWEDLEFADTPFDEVVRAARAARSPWHGHLDLILTVIDLTRRPAPALGGVPGTFVYPAGDRTEDPVIVTAVLEQDALSLRVDHDPTIVPAAAAAGIAEEALSPRSA